MPIIVQKQISDDSLYFGENTENRGRQIIFMDISAVSDDSLYLFEKLGYSLMQIIVPKQIFPFGRLSYISIKRN